MELKEEELDNVVGGIPYEDAVENALENEDLFRDKTIEELKQLKKEILSGSTELTEEDLDNVKAGIIR